MRTLLPLLLLLVAAASTAGEPAGRLSSGSVTLLSRNRHNDYERATFSFEHGLRDDPGLRTTRNDWDLHFGGSPDSFQVNTVTDDRSRILDLGARTLAELDALPELPPFERETTDNVPAVAGHLYLVHTKDSDSDHFSVFRVDRLVPGDSCTIEWVHWRRVPPREELALEEETRTRLAGLLDAAHAREQDAARRRMGVIQDPANMVMQLRTGAQGGNPSRFTLVGVPYRLPEGPSTAELDITRRPWMDDEPQWYLRGGHVPPGRALLILAVDVFAMAEGDSNGHGEVLIRIGSERVFGLRDDGGPYQVWHEGAAVVLPGQEEQVSVEAANSSALEVRLGGRFVDPEEAAKVATRRFHPARPPEGARRAGGNVEGAHPGVLLEPRVVLQLRAGAGGGNPNRVSMLGRASIYVDRMSNKPLSFDRPVSSREDAVGYVDGGRIPHGKVFVIRRVVYSGTAAGDSNGRGEVVLRILGETLVFARDSDEPIRGTWTGTIPVPSGREHEVILEVANSSTAQVTIEGEFVEDE